MASAGPASPGTASSPASPGSPDGVGDASASVGGLPVPLPEVSTDLNDDEEKVLQRAIADGRVKLRTTDGKTHFITLQSGLGKGDVSVGGAADIALRRSREEAQLRAEIADLEDQREVLQQQIDVLKGPVRTEARAVRALQRRVLDAEVDLYTTRSRNMDEKEVRQAEFAKLQSRVDDLKSVVAQEKAQREANESRYAELRAKGEKLRREAEEEKQKQEWQKLELRKAEQQLEDTLNEQKNLQKMAKNAEELTEEIAARCNDLRHQQKTLRAAGLDLRSELHKVKAQIADGQMTLRSKGDHSELQKEYSEKKKIWNALEAPAKLKEDVDFLTRENDNLRRNFTKATCEREALTAAEKMLRGAIQRASLTYEALIHENAALQKAVMTLGQDAKALLSEEANWSSDDDEPEHDASDDEGLYAPVNAAHAQSLHRILNEQ